MENFKKFTERIASGMTSETTDVEVQGIVESSLGVLKNDLWDTKEKINQLNYHKELLETLRKSLSEEVLDLKYGDIQTAIDLIDGEVYKLTMR